ncbi:MAG: PTS transporter subunit EIIC [Solobacterium sp.]|nr:PTS transporter subunit EIIC [Solobacterium sp.]
MANASVKEIVAAMGGIENISAAAHCATRLRVTPKDKSKVDIAALKKIEGVMGVVDGATQTQIVIGAEVANVYAEFCEYTGVSEQAEIDDPIALKEDLKGKKGAGLTLFFETVARIFNPIVPALAGCGFLSAIIMVAMAFGASMQSETFATFVAISMAVFTFIPFLLASSTAKVFKMNEYVALTICAAMMASKWTGLIADGVEFYHFVGIPFRVIDYSSSVLPIVFAVIVASYIEKGLNKLVKGPLKIILVPAFTILFGTMITFWTVGPITYAIGQGIANGMNWLFEHGGWIAGLIYGGIYSGMVVLGIHHGMVPVLTQMIATQGFNYVSPTSGSANIGQAGAAFGVWLKTKNKAKKANAASACFAACVGITEPVVYGVTVPNGKTFLFAAIGGAVGGGLAGILRLKAYAMGGPSFLNFGMFLGGENALMNCALVMLCFVVAFVVAAALTFFFWNPDEAE